MKLIAEITLTLVLFVDASRISVRALRREYAVPLRLLGLGLPLTIATGAVLGVAVLPGVSLIEALVLAVMLACTDAALGQAVVTDRRVPSRIRQGLNVESGLNDGLACRCSCSPSPWPRPRRGTCVGELVLEEIGYGLVGGVAAGVLGGLALRLAARHHASSHTGCRSCTVTTALLAAGVATGLGGSIFIAAFTAGFVFGVLRRDRGGEVTYLADEAGEVFNAVTFIIFGAVILGPVLAELTWELVLYAVLSLTSCGCCRSRSR